MLLTLLPAHGTLSLLLGCLTSLDMRLFVYSCCVLLCCVCLISLGGLLFPELKQKRSGWESTERSGGRERVAGKRCMREFKKRNSAGLGDDSAGEVFAILGVRTSV